MKLVGDAISNNNQVTSKVKIKLLGIANLERIKFHENLLKDTKEKKKVTKQNIFVKYRETYFYYLFEILLKYIKYIL